MMAKFEGDILLAWVCCHGLWLLLAEVRLPWVMAFACLLWVVAFDYRSLPPWVESVFEAWV